MKLRWLISMAVTLFFILVTGVIAADYYLPYAVNNATQGTGVAVRNLSPSDNAAVTITTYNQAGTAVETLERNIAANGQDAFLTATETTVEGWTHVESDQPLGGLSFIAKKGTDNYMADVPFTSKLQTAYLLNVPHVDQGSNWDTVIMACNPNSSSATLTATIVDKSGATVASQAFLLSANGSADISISSITGGDVKGSVQLSCNQPIASFVLYNNLKTGGYSYAGINAVNPLEEDGGWELYDDFSTGRIDTAKWTVDSSSATVTVEGGAVKFVHDFGFANDSSWLEFINPDKIMAVKATIRVGTCSGDVRGRIAGNILDDTVGNYIWQEIRVMDRDDEIQSWVGGVDPQTDAFYQLHYNELESPVTIAGNTFTLSTVFTLPTLRFRADTFGAVSLSPEGLTADSQNTPFIGIGTRSTNGEGPCTVYFDDVYVIYKD